jgi:hypothetical protein
MCITVDEAILTATKLLVHQVEHEGKTVNVLGYQNTADSKNHGGANAMIIPIPSAVPMTQANCVDMTGVGDAFKDYAYLVQPRSRGVDLNEGVAVAAGPADSLEVFESGSYTVLLSADLSLVALREAMNNLPADKRIELDLAKAKIIRAFKKLYPGWHIAICVWSGYMEAEPILWWYEPMPEYVGNHFLPGLDAHDGNPPQVGADVEVDHTLLVGAPPDRRYEDAGGNAQEVVAKTPEHLRKWLPTNVFGTPYFGKMRNGDWVVPKDGWAYGSPNYETLTKHVAPPGHTG